MDPVLIDRELQRAATAAKTWLRSLDAQPDASEAPLRRHRLLLGKARFDEVSALPDDDPLRTPLRRCIARYAEVRINCAWLARIAHQTHEELHGLTEPVREQRTVSAMRRAALCEAPLREAWVREWLGRGRPAAESQIVLWQRRREIGLRLGVIPSADLELPLAGSEINEHARGWLTRTQSMAEEFQRENLADWLSLALGVDAAEGWPAALTERSIAHWFRDSRLLEDLRLHTPKMPAAYGASSYLRALALLGYAVREAGASKQQPFCIAHDPYGLESNAMAMQFARLLAASLFLQRNLSLSAAKVRDHQRCIGRLLLLESRNRAAKFLLREPALEGEASIREAYPALMYEALGCTLKDGALGVLFTPNVGDAAKYCGVFLGEARYQYFVENHDEDWFRNPRGVDELRSGLELPPETTVTSEQLALGADQLYDQLKAWL